MEPARESRCSISLVESEVSGETGYSKKEKTHFPVLIPPDALVYCSRRCEDDPKGSMSSAYESDMVRGVNSADARGGESETTLVARAWSRRASDQRMGVRNGRTLGWASVGCDIGKKDGRTCDRLDQISDLRSPSITRLGVGIGLTDDL